MRLLFTRLAILVLLAVLLWGPNVIQALYRSATPDSVMQSQRKEYSRLDNAEVHLTGTAKIENQKARYKLFLWFHARGFPIDESDGEVSFWQPWRDLFGYWCGDDGSRFYPASPDSK
jgi:hypothetical protein